MEVFAETRQRALGLGVVSLPNFTLFIHVSTMFVENVFQAKKLTRLEDSDWGEIST